jgi:hypothetical protein
MDEYIIREKAIKELREVYENEYPTASGDFDEYASHDVPNVLRNMKAADVQPVNQWISVNDRLPEAVEEDVNGKIAFSEFVLVYLVYDNGFTYITNDKCRVDDKSWLHEIPGEGCKVTHWQPLPEPPKDGEQND